MLLRLGAENLWSIRNYQELSLIASSLKDSEQGIITVPNFRHKILPAVGIYGANASGKSNILRIIGFLVRSILNSQTKWQSSKGIDRSFFRLDPAYKSRPSRIDCDFILDDVHYHYGFWFNDSEFLEEWLYAYPKGRKQVWFHRSPELDRMKFGDEFPGQNRIIESLTRPNSLFLSSAAQSNHEKIAPIYKFFSENFIITKKNLINNQDFGMTKYLENDSMKRYVLETIKRADVGVSDAIIEERAFPEKISLIFNEFYNAAQKHLDSGDTMSPIENKEKILKLGHKSKDGSTVFFEIHDESRGTIELLNIIGPISEAIQQGKILIIDEIDSSLHSNITTLLLNLFCSKSSNKNGGQIIFTTHDTNILSSRFLRRDQVWFTEKDDAGETHLYPLTDILTRKTDNFEKGYLQGRFGAVPFLGDMESLFDYETIDKGSSPDKIE